MSNNVDDFYQKNIKSIKVSYYFNAKHDLNMSQLNWRIVWSIQNLEFGWTFESILRQYFLAYRKVCLIFFLRAGFISQTLLSIYNLRYRQHIPDNKIVLSNRTKNVLRKIKLSVKRDRIVGVGASFFLGGGQIFMQTL